MQTETIALIGSGSWATALAKILQSNNVFIRWYIYRPETLNYLKTYYKNPRYLTSVHLDPGLMHLSDDPQEVLEESRHVLLAIPAIYLEETFRDLHVSLSGKKVISAIKGIIPGHDMVPSHFLQKQYSIPRKQMAVITGPSHAEEIALERLTYLTIAGTNPQLREQVANMLRTPYLKPVVNNDMDGIEYAGIIKNVYAIGAGIANGLGYGDNFMAVFLSNALREMRQFLDAVKPNGRDVTDSAYVGDLLVTSYSQFSRNRSFGTMIGKGYPVRNAMLEMRMVAEGYYAAKGISQISKQLKVHMPVAEGIHQILYNEKSPSAVFNSLINHMK